MEARKGNPDRPVAASLVSGQTQAHTLVQELDQDAASKERARAAALRMANDLTCFCARRRARGSGRN